MKTTRIKIVAEDWIKNVKPKWKVPEGFFKQSASKIADGLFQNSDSRQQATSRLNFYINRAGDNLSDEDQKRLHLAMEKLKAKY